jgi:hypothetical protein
LIRLVAYADEPRPFRGDPIGPEVLGEAFLREVDDRVCSRENWLRGAIVLVEGDDFCAGTEVPREVEDVADRRGTKRVN